MTWDQPEQVDNYIVDHEIGRGQMGFVYRAHHEFTEREVALKILTSDVAETDMAEERFRREVCVSARVDDDGVVEVYDAGRWEETFYYAMELLEGRELSEAMGQLGVTDGLHLLADASRTLAACHEAGIVHRDLKPDNIFLPAEGQTTKILDFGVASVRDAKRATQSGFTLGTPHYMSPEQARDARAVSPASDVWSMAVIAYEIASGRVPFTGDSAMNVMLSVIEHDPPSIEGRSAVADALDDLLRRAMVKDPAERIDDASVFARELEAIAERTSEEAIDDREPTDSRALVPETRDFPPDASLPERAGETPNPVSLGETLDDEAADVAPEARSEPSRSPPPSGTGAPSDPAASDDRTDATEQTDARDLETALGGTSAAWLAAFGAVVVATGVGLGFLFSAAGPDRASDRESTPPSSDSDEPAPTSPSSTSHPPSPQSVGAARRRLAAAATNAGADSVVASALAQAEQRMQRATRKRGDGETGSRRPGASNSRDDVGAAPAKEPSSEPERGRGTSGRSTDDSKPAGAANRKTGKRAESAPDRRTDRPEGGSKASDRDAGPPESATDPATVPGDDETRRPDDRRDAGVGSPTGEQPDAAASTSPDEKDDRGGASDDSPAPGSPDTEGDGADESSDDGAASEPNEDQSSDDESEEPGFIQF